MKVYRAKGTYYEMQADAKKADKGFETVEFPFAASPKADFVDWLNAGGKPAQTASQPVLLPERSEDDSRFRVFFKGMFAGVVMARSADEARRAVPDLIEVRLSA